MTGLFNAVTLIVVNAVPAVGFFGADWSAGTTLAVYWVENVVTCLFVAVRIAAHQRLSPRRGHFRYQSPGARRSSAGSFLSGFVVTSSAFSAAHGIFLAVILMMLNHKGEGRVAAVDWRDVGGGCVIVLVFLSLDLVVDLVHLRSWPFLRIEQAANRGLARMVVIHLTVIFGLLGLALTGAPSALFGIFVVLKTMYSLSLILPQYEPATPPRWFSRRFEEFWARDRAAEAQRRERNEEPVSRPGSRDPAAP